MATLNFRGEPFVVDVILRPFLSKVRWAIGGGLGALFVWLEWWWWVPAPLVVATVIIEIYLTLRSDRPVRIQIEEDKLVLDDRFAATLTVYRDSIHTMTVLTKRRPSEGRDGFESVVVLASDRRVLLAIATQTAEPHLLGVDVDDLDQFLGAQAGLLRAVAPPTRTCRQRVHNNTLIDAIAQFAHPAAGHRQSIRLWAGVAPALSPFGLHEEEPDGLLVLEGDRFEHRDDEGAVIHSGLLANVSWSVHLREAVLLRVAGEDEAQAGQLPLLVIRLAEVHIAIPAPLWHAQVSDQPLPEPIFHTHAPEGSVLLHALRSLRQLPPDLVPPPMQPPDASDTQGSGDPDR